MVCSLVKGCYVVTEGHRYGVLGRGHSSTCQVRWYCMEHELLEPSYLAVVKGGSAYFP